MRKLEREVVRLKAILRSSEIDPGAESTTGRRKEIFRLKDVIAQQAEELEELRAAIEKLRATRATHAKARFGSSSEKTGKAKPGSGRKRGQQAGKSGHGRTERPQTECRTETHNPPEADRICPCCAKPYVQNGSHDCEIVEIEVKAHVPESSPSSLAADLRLRGGTKRGGGTTGSPAVSQHGLRDQFLGLLSVRVLRLPPSAEPGPQHGWGTVDCLCRLEPSQAASQG